MLAQYRRDEFLERKFDYRPGESIGIICPTGGGKTHTAWQLARCALDQNPELGLTAIQPKPADDTTDRYVAEFGLKVSDTYPFRKKFWESEPTGWVHWPKHITTDADANQVHLAHEFKTSLNGEYWKGDRLVIVDDAYIIEALYGANKEVDQVLTAGRSNDVGAIFCLQAPKGTVHGGSVSGFHYSQPTHLLLGKDSVASNRQRFAEIAMGLDPKLIDDVVTHLRTYRIGDSAVSELLYLDRRGPYAAIISPF